MVPDSQAVLSDDLVRAAAAAAPITASARTDDVPPSWDERTILTTMLDYVRDTVHVKCVGLTDEQARRAPLPGSPLTTISTLVSHLRWVEHYWIRVILLGEDDPTPTTEDDPDAEMRLGLNVPLTRLLAEYRASCGQLSRLVAPLDLDTPSRGALSWRDEPVTLRWVLFHLIEETARHNGHIDILREMADGVTGRLRRCSALHRTTSSLEASPIWGCQPKGGPELWTPLSGVGYEPCRRLSSAVPSGLPRPEQESQPGPAA